MAVTPETIKEEIERKRSEIGQVDIVVGIPSYNNARTINHVVSAVDTGLTKYFKGQKSVIVNSDGGSTDGTTETVRSASPDHKAVFLAHPISPIHRITTPYHGLPGKGSAFRTIFSIARELEAKACCVVDADLRSITPEWVELLLLPVYREGFDFVAPLYTRHKYDGTITNSVIYPVTRALYGRRIRQPIGGEFGFSGRLASHYLSQDVWHTDVARFGIDIWMTTEAIAGGFPICQAYLGAKIHDPKDPGADLSDMFVQVIGSLLSLTVKHHLEWKDVSKTEDVPSFGFRYSVGVVPIRVNIERMVKSFRLGAENLRDVWGLFLDAAVVSEIMAIASKEPPAFHFPDELWARVVYDCILAYRHKRLSSEHLLKSIIPLYFGRTASFFLDVEHKSDEEAEEAIEKLCAEYERCKAHLVGNW